MYETPASQVLGRGEDFFDRCYGKVAERVRASLDHSGTEDLGFAVRLAYGYVLSTTAVLSEVETSFVMIAGLIPQDVSVALCSQPGPWCAVLVSRRNPAKGDRGRGALAPARGPGARYRGVVKISKEGHSTEAIGRARAVIETEQRLIMRPGNNRSTRN